MKKICLIRHAKSAWETENITDFERPLNERGRKDALIVAKWIKQHNYNFDLIVSSPATRALITSRIILEHLEIPFNKIETEERFYEGNVDDALEYFQQISNEVNTVLIFGHNPTIHNLAIYLAKFKYEHVKTSSFIEIELEASNWNDVVAGCGVVVNFIYPKVLQENNFNPLL